VPVVTLCQVRRPLQWLDERIAWTDSEDAVGTVLASREAMARFLGALFVAGAVIGLASIALPQPDRVDRLGLLLDLLAALATGVIVYRSRERIRPRTLQASLTLATAFVTLGIYFSNWPESFYAYFYVWISMMAFFFLSRSAALLQVALIGAAYGVALGTMDAEQGVARWLVSFGVMAISGVIVGVLKERVLRLISRVTSLERHRIEELHARDLNDNVIQGLTLAKYAFDAGQPDRGKAALTAALEEARRMMTAALRDAEVEGGMLRRQTPAGGVLEDPGN
jgi:signal transduction histidine kinase